MDMGQCAKTFFLYKLILSGVCDGDRKLANTIWKPLITECRGSRTGKLSPAVEKCPEEQVFL
jgi:hypothetical protein